MFHYFTIKFHFSFFASFCFKVFASLHLSNFCFEAKQSKANFKSIFSLFFRFFFRFKFFASLRFSNFCFEEKQSEAKFKSIFSYFFSFFFTFFSLFLVFFRFFSLFSLNFRFASIFSLNFCFFLPSFSLQIFGVSHRSESCEIRLFFCFQAKQNFCFNFKFRFRSESEGAPYFRLPTANPYINC